MKEKLIELFDNWDNYLLTGDDCAKLASEIEELYKDYYPVQFTEWLSFGSHPFVPWFDETGHYYTDEINDKKWFIAELYEHWKTIKDK